MQIELERPDGLSDDSWAAIEDSWRRLSDAVANGDHRLAIGSAKELVEGTARVVIHARGETAPSNADLPAVLTRAHAMLERQPGPGLAQDGSARQGGV